MLPGNLGLHDQALALHWARENARAFGGNPGRITVWGESSGAVSSAYLAISPLTRDLLQVS